MKRKNVNLQYKFHAAVLPFCDDFYIDDEGNASSSGDRSWFKPAVNTNASDQQDQGRNNTFLKYLENSGKAQEEQDIKSGDLRLASEAAQKRIQEVLGYMHGRVDDKPPIHQILERLKNGQTITPQPQSSGTNI